MSKILGDTFISLSDEFILILANFIDGNLIKWKTASCYELP